MLWFFRKHKIPTLGMLDIMAAVTCIVHGFGRMGCFLAGCCYGKPTQSWFSVIFTDPACQAEPLNSPLIPTQLLEAGYLFSLLGVLLFLRKRKQFDGQLFLLYLIAYAIGRGILELYRGDIDRGFVLGNLISNSQLVSLVLISLAIFFYVRLKRKSQLSA
jgi:phosphatidylglycerol:prolipoprotein diacylglycerol transferase